MYLIKRSTVFIFTNPVIPPSWATGVSSGTERRAEKKMDFKSTQAAVWEHLLKSLFTYFVHIMSISFKICYFLYIYIYNVAVDTICTLYTKITRNMQATDANVNIFEVKQVSVEANDG